MIPLYYLGIIEGVVHARGEDAFPVKFWQALKLLGDHLKAPSIIDADVAQKSPAEPPLLPETIIKEISEKTELKLELLADIGEGDHLAMRPWSDEDHNEIFRLKDIEKLRWSEIAKKVNRTKSACMQRYSKSHKKEPRIDTSAEKLIADHDEYAGKRDDGILTENDIPDICHLLIKKRRSVSQVASDYDVSFEKMRKFVDKHNLMNL